MTADEGPGGMNEARLQALIRAHGAASERWPEAEREAALTLLARSKAARRMMAEAAALDALLDTVPAPAPSSALVGRLIAAAPPPPPPLWRGWFAGLAIAWRPATAMLVAGLAGIAVGSSGLHRPAALALDVDLVTFAFAESDDEAEGGEAAQ